jgi:integrin alpha FG-GAP repeat containing protein 1
MRLISPSINIGLGRTNNYLQMFSVGVSYGKSSNYTFDSGIIPNSNLIVIPPVENKEWSIELYINPSSYAMWVVISAAIATVVLAIVVYVLHMFEKREDEKEKRKALHMINFDAL